MNITVKRKGKHGSNWTLRSDSFSRYNEKCIVDRPSFAPDVHYYETGSVIGKSSFSSGVVCAGKYSTSSEFVAIKKYNLETIRVEEIDSILQELCILHQLKHSRIISVLTSFVVGFEIYVVFPLMVYGSCADLINNHFHTGLPEVVIKMLVKDVLLALSFIHSKGIIHRAIKGSHILIGSDGHAKLSGFRSAYQKPFLNKYKNVYDYPSNSTSNLKWLSPDILQQNLVGYDEKADIYSLGITVCELANGIVPYSDIKYSTMLVDKMSGCTPRIYDVSTKDKLKDTSDEETFKIFYNCYSTRSFSKHLHSFKDLCCTQNSKERPTAQMLLLHSLISKTNQTKKIFSQLILPALPITENDSFFQESHSEDDQKENNQDLSFSWDF